MRLITWLRHNRPSREAMLESRWLRPFASTLGNPALWQFNRKSVTRGVALGLFFGFAIPFGQAPAAAVFAVPWRANLAIAALCTFISNPFTTPFIYVSAYELGAKLTRAPEAATMLENLHRDNWAHQLKTLIEGSPLPIAIGLVLLGVVAGAIGFAAMQVVWRVWVRQRWHARRERRLARNGAAA